MTDFNLEIPDELHAEFKIISVRKKKSMRDLLVKIIGQYVKDNASLLKIAKPTNNPKEEVVVAKENENPNDTYIPKENS